VPECYLSLSHENVISPQISLMSMVCGSDREHMRVIILHRSKCFSKLFKLYYAVLVLVKPQKEFIDLLWLWEHAYCVQPLLQTLFVQFTFKNLIRICKIKVHPLHESNFLTIKLSFNLSQLNQGSH
jgi:hypothetical protein